MPKFSSAYISDSPKALSSHQQAATLSESTQAETDVPVEEKTINLAPIDCSKSTEVFNAAPQANNFANSSIDFIRNLQAQTNSYDCIVRQQVFNRSAELTEEGELTTVVSAWKTEESDEYASWEIPTDKINESADRELNINVRGLLSNTSNGKSKTRVDLIQKEEDNLFLKIVRTTLLTMDDTTNIRSSIVMEMKDKTGKLLAQRIGGRIVFDNKVSVIAAAIIPGTGAISYLKQCNETTAASSDDYMRECNAQWQPLAYDSNWQLQTGPADIRNLMTSMNLNNQGDSVMDEVKFFLGQYESDFFTDRSLPPQI